MQSFNDTLKIQYDSCPPGCAACVDACAKAKNGGSPEASRIRVLHLADEGFNGASTCLQCGVPECVAVCPTGALTRSDADGTVRISEEKCVGCALCTVACPYGGALYDQVRKKAYKCDRCDGEPKCVDSCEYGVLSLLRTQRMSSYLRTDDPFVKGTGLCFGCPAELAARLTMRILGDDTFLFSAPGCACLGIVGLGTETTTRLPATMCLMTNVPSTMTGVKRYYKSQGKDVRVVAFVGDGVTVDIGFQPLSGAAERGENIIYICYDNEAYMNTGVQRSGSTPLGAWTNTSPVGRIRRGKERPAKNMPLLMAFHQVPYVATATIAHLEDYARKLEKAREVKDGLVYIHLLSPCPTGWRSPTDSALEVCQAAVDTNFFPLWEAEYGRFRLTNEVKHPKPVRAYTGLMGRFGHLRNDEIEELQRTVDSDYARLKALCTIL